MAQTNQEVKRRLTGIPVAPVTDVQMKIAQARRAALEKTKPYTEAIVIEIVLAGAFYPAAEGQRDYYQKNPIHYKYCRSSCGARPRVTDTG